MITGKNSNGQPPKDVHGLADEQRNNAEAYLQGMVYGWCASQGTKRFATRDLVGGVNWNWEGTPLQCVYDKQENKKTAHDVAGQEVGRLLKRVIIKDQRKFTCDVEHDGNYYQWDGEYPKKS